MALVQGAFPYDLNELLGGVVRVVLQPYDDAAIPDSPIDIFDQVAPYETNGDFADLGATTDDFTYGRALEVSGYEIQQVQGNVFEEVADSTRTVSVPMAQIGPAGLKIIEQQADDPELIAAALGSSAYDAVDIGTISDLQRYTIAFVARRNIGSGEVVEGVAGPKRGRFVVGVGYNVAVTADNVEMGIGKGTLASAQITFKFFPESSKVQGKEFGRWFFERAGEIDLTP